jgi:hypothetical protein
MKVTHLTEHGSTSAIGITQSMITLFSTNGKKRREDISITGATKKRSVGGRRKPKLEDIEDILADEIVNLQLQKLKVIRTFIRERAKQMAEEANIGEEFKASSHWATLYLRRNGFSLRRTTNLTTLTDDQLIQRAVDYMHYLQVS